MENMEFWERRTECRMGEPGRVVSIKNQKINKYKKKKEKRERKNEQKILYAGGLLA
jgi:hypothetical protein